MNFKILNSSTNKIINRSTVRPADDTNSPNLRADPPTSPEVIKSLHDDSITNPTETASNNDESPSLSKWPMHIPDTSDLVGISFLLNK